MSRVKAVVENTIMVHIHDVVPGDVLSLSNSGIKITNIDYDENRRRFHYGEATDGVKESYWIDPKFGPHVFLLDINNERGEQ